MGLPTRFRNVNYYRIAGKYIFAGDLFITRETIYFFPEIDLEEQRHELTRDMPHQIGLLVFGVIYIMQKFGGSYTSRIEFWKDGLLPEEFERQVGLHIEQLRVEKSYAAFARPLPMPTCVSASEITDMKLSPTGRLSFTAQSDRHDFYVGLFKKKRVRNALWEAGLGRV